MRLPRTRSSAVPHSSSSAGAFSPADAAQVYDSGIRERTVLLEFDSVEHAIAAHDSPAYQEALRLLGDAVDRDLRIVEAVE